MVTRRRKRIPRAQAVELGFLEALRKRVGDDPDVLKALGDLYTRSGRWEAGLAVDLTLARLCPRDPLVWYNLGCSLALLERRDEAFEALRRAIGLGYRDFEWMRRDRDLEALREDSRFRALLAPGSPTP